MRSALADQMEPRNLRADDASEAAARADSHANLEVLSWKVFRITRLQHRKPLRSSGIVAADREGAPALGGHDRSGDDRGAAARAGCGHRRRDRFRRRLTVASGETP